MKKTKRLVSTPTSRHQRSSGTTVPQESLPGKEPLISSTSLLNKYNQKEPSGTRKRSPAADEEME